jgi:hypothetical protein
MSLQVIFWESYCCVINGVAVNILAYNFPFCNSASVKLFILKLVTDISIFVIEA